MVRYAKPFAGCSKLLLLLAAALAQGIAGCGNSTSLLSGPVPPAPDIGGDPAPMPPIGELSAKDDNAGPRDCGPAVSPAGSRIVRVLPDGPRRDDGSLAFTSGVCVYLPPGYDDGLQRYPVIYYFHGGTGGQSVIFTDLLDAAYQRDPRSAVILVGPDGTSPGAWFDRFDNFMMNPQAALGTAPEEGLGSGRTLNETYVLQWLLPYIDQRFRTLPQREGRAAFGISNGGHGATLLAAKAPDRFATVAVSSGNVAWQSFALGGEQFLDPVSGQLSFAYRAGNLAVNLAPNLDAVDLMFDIGTSCPPAGATGPACSDASWGFEQLFVPGNRALQDALETVQHLGANDYRETVGGHAIEYWQQWFAERHLPFMLERLRDPQAAAQPLAPAAVPEHFRYRSVAERFSVYGYEVQVTRDVREFLDLAAVTAERIVISGSGAATLQTAGRYRPGRDYRIVGATAAASEDRVTADARGRLRLQIDLGPSNPAELDGYGDASGFAHADINPAPKQIREITIAAAP